MFENFKCEQIQRSLRFTVCRLGEWVKNIQQKVLKGPLVSLSILSDMHEPARVRQHLLHRSIPCNVLQHVFSCVFDPEMSCFLLLPLRAAQAEVSPVGLTASTEQIRRGDDGHESPRFPGGLVQLWKTGACQTPDDCPAIEELKPLPHQITSIAAPGCTVPPGQAQDAWGVHRM